MPGANVLVFALVGGRAYAAATATTDDAGKATVRDLPRGEHWIVVDARRRARASSRVVVFGDQRAVELELGEEHTANIEVRDEQNAPIPGAEIEVTGREPLPVGARTNEDGRARVGRLGPPPWIVLARAPGYEEVSQRDVRESGARMTLRRLGAIAVHVVGADDVPAAGARVLVAGPSLWPARVAETKEDGVMRIGALTAGSYAMRATKGDLVSAVDVAVPLARGEEKSVTLKLFPGIRVSAVVSDENGGLIAGARVTLVETGLSPFPLEATTDRAGRAILGPIARGAAALSVSADGFVPRGAVAVPEPLEQDVEIALARAGTFEGRVVDGRGFPVDGASIVVVGTDFAGAPIDEDPRRSRFRQAHFDAALRGPAALVPMGELGVMPGPVPPIPHGMSMGPTLPTAGGSNVPPSEPWVTRADGTFRAAPVSPGRVRVLVRHPQYTDGLSDIVTLRSGGQAHVDVVMRAGGLLEGRVVDANGRAVAVARVSVAAVRGSMERATKSAGDGTFAFASLPEQVVVAVADEEDTEPVARLPVTIPDGERRSVTIALPEPRSPLDARVVDDRGYPVDKAQIGVQSLDPGAPLRVTVFTNARGEAQIPRARGLPLRVEVRAPSRAPKVVTVEAEAAGLLVALEPAVSARGHVQSARGRGDPIPDAEIVMYTELGARRAKTDRDGAYMLAELAAGPARLRVRASGYAPKEMTVSIDVALGGGTVTLPRVELSGEGIVEGTVVDARGEAVQGARVARDRVPVYLAVGATPPGVAVSDAHGHFRLVELAEGTCALEVFAPDFGRSRIDGVRVVAGRTSDLGKVVVRNDGDVAGDLAARGGVAVTLGETESGDVVLVSVAESSEAERAGLVPGDALVEIDGARPASIADARKKLSGPVGDDVVVKLRRGERSMALRVPREEVRR